MDYVFVGTCVGLNGDDIDKMVDTAISVKERTLRRHCEDFAEIVKSLGYRRDFPISKDWHVSYHKGKFQNKPCYYLQWSGFEYVWVKA